MATACWKEGAALTALIEVNATETISPIAGASLNLGMGPFLNSCCNSDSTRIFLEVPGIVIRFSGTIIAGNIEPKGFAGHFKILRKIKYDVPFSTGAEYILNSTIIASIGIPLLVLCALLGHHVVRAKVDPVALEEHQGTGYAVLGLIGTLFSVLIGFMVVASLDNYHDARQHVQMEANALGNIYRLAHGLADVDRRRIRALCREYCNAVVDDEWAKMESKETSDIAWTKYRELWDATVSVKPADVRESDLLQAILAADYIYAENRRARIVQSQNGFLPAALWVVIIFGALMTIAITYTFSGKWVGYQRLMIVLVSLSLGLNIWLLVVFNSPFAGELKINPDMFVLDRDVIFKDADSLPSFLDNKSLLKDKSSPK